MNYHIFHTIGHSGFPADVSHKHGLGEQTQQTVHVTQETVKDISLPLHKHLRLYELHTRVYVVHVMTQLKFLPVTPGFYMLVVAQQDFFSSLRFYFYASHLSLQSWGRVT